MLKVANINARQAVTEKVEFNGSNTFGRWYDNGVYVVFSYGYHFPMYVNIRGVWYENEEKYSVSTSKQQTQLRPLDVGKIYKRAGTWLKTQINETVKSCICR